MNWSAENFPLNSKIVNLTSFFNAYYTYLIEICKILRCRKWVYLNLNITDLTLDPDLFENIYTYISFLIKVMAWANMGLTTLP